jgi:hypothetical protein
MALGSKKIDFNQSTETVEIFVGNPRARERSGREIRGLNRLA